MSRTHAKDLNFSFNAVALEGELETVDQSSNVPEAEITAFADLWQNFLAGNKVNHVTEIAGSYDPEDGAGFDALFASIGGGKVSTIFDPTGAGPGSDDPQYQSTASGLTGAEVSRLSLSLPVGGKAAYGATIQHSGVMVRATA